MLMDIIILVQFGKRTHADIGLAIVLVLNDQRSLSAASGMYSSAGMAPPVSAFHLSPPYKAEMMSPPSDEKLTDQSSLCGRTAAQCVLQVLSWKQFACNSEGIPET